MRIKTSDLIGPALDWAVAKCEGWEFDFTGFCDGDYVGFTEEERISYLSFHHYSTNWVQGGPIIERERINILSCDGGDYYQAHIYDAYERIEQFGSTHLIAAMRCYCCAKLGDEIEIPQELQPCQQPNR